MTVSTKTEPWRHKSLIYGRAAVRKTPVILLFYDSEIGCTRVMCNDHYVPRPSDPNAIDM